ncbi:MAG: DUF6686 family protein [Tenacibaculum sp.]
MCNNSRILSRTKNGELSICKGCKAYSLIYNNILLQFNKKEFNNFKEYIININVDYWLDFYEQTTQKRKIPIPTKHRKLFMFFTENELNELKEILLINTNIKRNLFASDINYPLILN